MLARLVRRGWLLRGVEFSLEDGPHVVEYDGRGMGYEQVTADGVVIRKTRWDWFVPRFEFKVGGWPGLVEIRVWPWLLLRSLVLRVGDRVIYAEGVPGLEKRGGISRGWDDLA
jgi:hypothetical protein